MMPAGQVSVNCQVCPHSAFARTSPDDLNNGSSFSPTRPNHLQPLIFSTPANCLTLPASAFKSAPLAPGRSSISVRSHQPRSAGHGSFLALTGKVETALDALTGHPRKAALPACRLPFQVAPRFFVQPNANPARFVHTFHDTPAFLSPPDDSG